MSYFSTFYRPEQVGQTYAPDVTAAISEGQVAGFSHAHADCERVILLLVDPQIDFIHTDGALAVPGAVADTRRTIEWILHHTGKLTTIAASMDSHILTQIFFPTWWVNPAGEHPLPFTSITSQDVAQRRWQPVFRRDWSLTYMSKLEASAKKELMIWPYHTMIGTPGHAITPALYEVMMYHAAARESPPVFLDKGSIPETEHYSILEPEVKFPEHPQGTLNLEFLKMLVSHDLIYVAGQAKSHCVLETITSAMNFFQGKSEEMAEWRILTDCMSSVVHPKIDFDAMADAAFTEFSEQGLHLVTSDDPIF